MKTNSWIYTPTEGPNDWQELLADPEKHWRPGFSAHSLAHSWEGVTGWPKAIYKTLRALKLEPVFGFPEYSVDLPSRGKGSQNDLWLLARDEQELWSVAVEGKVQEDFGPMVGDWLDVKKNHGRLERLDGLKRMLNVQSPNNQIASLRYQLFHRTASAVLMAQKLHARKALMVVHSFEQDDALDHFEDFEKFIQEVFSIQVPIRRNERIGPIHLQGSVDLYVAWVREEMPVVKIQTQTHDEVPMDIEERFEKAFATFLKEFKPDSYTRSYPAFQHFFQGKTLTPEMLIQGIHMIYGWMPTIFEFKGDGDYQTVLEILTHAQNGEELKPSDYELLKVRFNNSLVGTSKLLHFINPEVFPIWDSRICKIFFDKPAHQYRVGSVANFMAYKKWIGERIKTPEFEDVHSAVNSRLGYTVSKVRAAELVLFVGGKG